VEVHRSVKSAPNPIPNLPKGTHAIVTALLHTLAIHNREKVGHCQRVARQCNTLAFALGLNAEERAQIHLAARLHDIGEIGVPAAILFKAGPLTQGEWVEMRRHPEHAHRILTSLPSFHIASHIIYCHHEDWDGHGYPRGLKGRHIPLGARILSVVDVWDALQSDRPHRPAWSRPEAKEYLRTRSGSQFDPEVAAAFLELAH